MYKLEFQLRRGMLDGHSHDSANEQYYVRDYMSAYRQASNISPTLVGNKFVDHSDAVGASPVGDAPATSSR